MCWTSPQIKHTVLFICFQCLHWWHTSYWLFGNSSQNICNIKSFAVDQKSLIKPLPPFEEKTLSATLTQQLLSIYKQLHPDCNITHMPRFYKEYGRLSMAGDIVGSVAVRGASNPASSVIMAYWPGTGFSLENIDSTTMSVGVVQYYLKHSITMTYGDSVDTSAVRTFPHLFCYIHWKKVHPQAMWCGVSATISS